MRLDEAERRCQALSAQVAAGQQRAEHLMALLEGARGRYGHYVEASKRVRKRGGEGRRGDAEHERGD